MFHYRTTDNVTCVPVGKAATIFVGVRGINPGAIAILVIGTKGIDPFKEECGANQVRWIPDKTRRIPCKQVYAHRGFHQRIPITVDIGCNIRIAGGVGERKYTESVGNFV